jgi:phage gpG-like protein
MKLVQDPKSLLDPITRRWARQRDFLEEVGATFAGIAIERIEKKKAGPDGVKWAPWASATRKARRKEGSAGTGLLLRTGALRDSITYEVQGQKVSVKTDNPYAGYLQNGTNKMPARPFLGFGRVEEREMQTIWKKWMDT